MVSVEEYLERKKQQAVAIVTAFGFNPNEVPEDGWYLQADFLAIETFAHSDGGRVLRKLHIFPLASWTDEQHSVVRMLGII